MDFSLAGEQLPISSFFSSSSKRKAGRGGARSPLTKRFKQKDHLPTPDATPKATSKENFTSHVQPKLHKASPAAGPSTSRDLKQGVQATSRHSKGAVHARLAL